MLLSSEYNAFGLPEQCFWPLEAMLFKRAVYPNSQSPHDTPRFSRFRNIMEKESSLRAGRVAVRGPFMLLSEEVGLNDEMTQK